MDTPALWIMVELPDVLWMEEMTTKCRECGKKFVPRGYHRQIYCSEDCARKVSNKQRQNCYSLRLRHKQDILKWIRIYDLKAEFVYYIPEDEYEHYKQAYDDPGEFVINYVLAPPKDRGVTACK